MRASISRFGVRRHRPQRIRRCDLVLDVVRFNASLRSLPLTVDLHVRTPHPTRDHGVDPNAVRAQIDGEVASNYNKRGSASGSRGQRMGSL